MESQNLDSFSDETKAKVFMITENSLVWVDISTLTLRNYEAPRPCMFLDFAPLSDGRVLINGAMEIDTSYKTHSMFLFSDHKLTVKREHEIGLVSLSMIPIENTVYLIGAKKSQRYELSENRSYDMEEMISTHVNGGSCRYNNDVLVVGGVNSYEVELYNTQGNYWAHVMTLSFPVYDISCIQVTKEKVLVISAQECYLLDVEQGKLKQVEGLPIQLHGGVRHHVPIKQKDFVYTFVGSKERALLRYSISKDSWTVLARYREHSCCSLL